MNDTDLDLVVLDETILDHTLKCELSHHITEPRYHSGPGELLAIVYCPTCESRNRAVVCKTWAEYATATGGVKCRDHVVLLENIQLVTL